MSPKRNACSVTFFIQYAIWKLQTGLDMQRHVGIVECSTLYTKSRSLWPPCLSHISYTVSCRNSISVMGEYSVLKVGHREEIIFHILFCVGVYQTQIAVTYFSWKSRSCHEKVGRDIEIFVALKGHTFHISVGTPNQIRWFFSDEMFMKCQGHIECM